MIKVIKDRKVFVTHQDVQNVIGLYGEDIIICNGNEDDTKRYYYFHGCDSLFMKSQASGLEEDRELWIAKRTEHKEMIESWFAENDVAKIESM